MTRGAASGAVAPGADVPHWSARRYTDADRDTVLALFAEPDFYYRTAEPDTRPEWEILDLVGSDTRVLSADGEPVGLFAAEGLGSEHGCHYLLHLRLTGSAPLSWWRSAYREVVRGLRWRVEVVRLAMMIGEFDERGLEVARSLGLTEEGTLADVVLHGGRRSGYVYFSQIWTPSS
ncbi:MAG TPA: hypothetical protein VF054_06210 [Micromonosporaceae bacterium]